MEDDISFVTERLAAAKDYNNGTRNRYGFVKDGRVVWELWNSACLESLQVAPNATLDKDRKAFVKNLPGMLFYYVYPQWHQNDSYRAWLDFITDPKGPYSLLLPHLLVDNEYVMKYGFVFDVNAVNKKLLYSFLIASRLLNERPLVWKGMNNLSEAYGLSLPVSLILSGHTGTYYDYAAQERCKGYVLTPIDSLFSYPLLALGRFSMSQPFLQPPPKGRRLQCWNQFFGSYIERMWYLDGQMPDYKTHHFRTMGELVQGVKEETLRQQQALLELGEKDAR